MSQGVSIIEPYVAIVDNDLCGDCGMCKAVCPYQAINMENKNAKVNEVLCRGCGSCAAACPSKAITTNHFTDEQLLSQIREAIVRGD